MPRHEFFDEPADQQPSAAPQWSEADFLLDDGRPPEVFLDDVEWMRSMTAGYLSTLAFEKAPRQNDILVTRTASDPVSMPLVLYDALRHTGYDVIFARDGTSRAANISLYAPSEEAQNMQQVGDGVFNQPFGVLASDILSRDLSAYHFLADHPMHERGLQKYQAIPGGVDGEYVKRGFMTTALCTYLHHEEVTGDPKLQWILSSWERTPHYAIQQKLYNLFHAQGLRPYTYEELGGMFAGAVRTVTKSNPALLPAAQRKAAEAADEDEF